MVLPNLITVLAICAGLSGIRLAFEGRFESAVVMVLLAAFLDGIDGRLARMLKATSKFGAQMDSLADIVNFGVVPALVLYAYLLDKAGSLGWIGTLLFVIACGLRLARFNVLDEDLDRPAWQAEYFVGIPAPAGALVVMLPMYIGFLGVEGTRTLAYVATAFTILIAFLLVSRLPIYSGKKLKIKREHLLPVMLLAVFYVLLVTVYPWQTLSASVGAYLLFLPLSASAYARRAKIEGAAAAAAEAAAAQAPVEPKPEA
ncbi:CDP-diacylglycerol--serine O-phosphatidyltransferase [Aminobacter anthyllidis]|uniref:CDP-diacylglycerol--serine O-phosphatidyltransferase n=1 Tax=Aminobacter anthyllidis TaxID=1035067 RepID=UPI002456F551|nr:CDP-diacylglycerol--serine O-phosphatidyltransferase [Aminobacter anthyllidis]MDH4985641.1 CDP-diacylglycerol--serine O-phosphatidyltransferase [Aminobacter anthyllidis]